MASAAKFCAAAVIFSLAIAPAAAADLTAPAEPLPAPAETLPPPAPIFYVHAGFLAAFPVPNAQPTGGGFFNVVAPGAALGAPPLAALSNVTVRPVYTLGLEAGYFVTPNVAVAISTGVPPIEHYKATGFTGAALIGTNLLGSTRAGSVNFLLQYHFTQF